MEGKENICCLLLRGIKLKLHLSLDENIIVSAVKMFVLIGFRYDNWFYLSSLRSEILYDFQRFCCCCEKRKKLKDMSFMKVDESLSIICFLNVYRYIIMKFIYEN